MNLLFQLLSIIDFECQYTELYTNYLVIKKQLIVTTKSDWRTIN